MPHKWAITLPETIGLVLTAIMALALLITAIISWRRGHLGTKDALLQLLRTVAIALIVVTLMQPERIHEEIIHRTPELVILVDDTDSMKTKDVLGTDGKAAAREAWVKSRMNSKFWQSLNEKYSIHFENISAYSTHTEGSETRTGSDLNSALKAISDRYRNLRATMILTDGDWNLGGSPMAAATQHRVRQARIYPVLVGSDRFLPDVELIDVKAPAFCIHNEHVVIPFRVQSHLDRDIRTRIALQTQSRILATKEITLPAGQIVNDHILWHATIQGEHEFTVSTPVQEEEFNKDNNLRQFRMGIRKELLKVLVVDSRPRWEFRFLRNALMRDPGVDVHCLLLHPQIGIGGGEGYLSAFPKGKDEISQYDVIFIGDIGMGPDELTKEDLELVKGVVERQGSGLVFLPGQRGGQTTLPDSPIGPLLPIVPDKTASKGIHFRSPSPLVLTRLGSDHLLTLLTNSPVSNRLLWKNLPGFYWHAGVLRARPGADILAVHGTQRNQWGRIPLLVTLPYGNGNVLFMGTDSAWRWRRGVEDTYHYRFWGQVVRWMAHPRHLSHEKGIRVFFSPENPKQGDIVNFQATVFDNNGYPLTEGNVKAEIRSPSNLGRQLTLTPVEGGWGVYDGQFKAATQGTYRLILRAPGPGHHLETQIHVASTTIERIGVPARPGSLKDIARLTKGKFATTLQFDDIVETIRLLPKEEKLIHRFPLWSTWWWGLIILGVFTIYWIFRKAWGLV